MEYKDLKGFVFYTNPLKKRIKLFDGDEYAFISKDELLELLEAKFPIQAREKIASYLETFDLTILVDLQNAHFEEIRGDIDPRNLALVKSLNEYEKSKGTPSNFERLIKEKNSPFAQINDRIKKINEVLNGGKSKDGKSSV